MWSETKKNENVLLCLKVLFIKELFPAWEIKMQSTNVNWKLFFPHWHSILIHLTWQPDKTHAYEKNGKLHDGLTNMIRKFELEMKRVTLMKFILFKWYFPQRLTHHAQTDLNNKSGAMHQTLIYFKIDSQGLRKTKNENPLTQD